MTLKTRGGLRKKKKELTAAHIPSVLGCVLESTEVSLSGSNLGFWSFWIVACCCHNNELHREGHKIFFFVCLFVKDKHNCSYLLHCALINVNYIISFSSPVSLGLKKPSLRESV